MATFTNTITGASSVSDVATLLTQWAALLNGQLDNDNFDSDTFSADVANISDAADTKGFTMTGNIALPAGGTVDGVDPSELNQTVTQIQSTIDNDALTNDNFIVMTGGPVVHDTDLYTTFTTAYSAQSYSTTTHTLYYGIIGFNFQPLTDYGGTTDANYTLGNISAYCSGSTVKIAGKDRAGLAIKSADLGAYYIIIAIPKTT